MAKRLKLAILDLYDKTPNMGMNNIRQIVELFKDQVEYRVFDIRAKNEIPDTSYDIYISSGGPGDPRVGNGVWDKAYFDLLDQIREINKKQKYPTKFLFLICHSFQMACHHWKIGKVTKRNSRSFGTFPVHRTRHGWDEPLFQLLPEPFYVADFRDYQVVQTNPTRLAERGVKILALEKIRPHVQLERAVMAIRFSPAIFGTQFHPEADARGMLIHFDDEKRMEEIIKNHDEEKYIRMMNDLSDPQKIALTHQTVIPAFIGFAIKSLTKVYARAS